VTLPRDERSSFMGVSKELLGVQRFTPLWGAFGILGEF